MSIEPRPSCPPGVTCSSSSSSYSSTASSLPSSVTPNPTSSSITSTASSFSPSSAADLTLSSSSSISPAASSFLPSSVTTTNSTSSSSSSVSPTTPATLAAVSKPNAGAIAGGVVGGVVFIALLVLAALLYLRARKRERTAPSSEFLNSIKAGAAPVLRLDSGVEYSPALSEKGRPPCPPPPFIQNSYPPIDATLSDDVLVTDVPSRRPSVERPLHPQRSSVQQPNDSFIIQHRPSTSIGSRRELWGSHGDLSPVRPSPDTILEFAPRFSFSLDDDLPATPPSQFSHSPPSLRPLRRQPDLDLSM